MADDNTPSPAGWLRLSRSFPANVDTQGAKITGLPTPTAASDAATKAYVDGHTSGGTVTSVAAGDGSITIGGTASDPTVAVATAGVTEGKLSLTDVTTGNVTSAAHGFAPKSPANAGKFLNGAATPAFAFPYDNCFGQNGMWCYPNNGWSGNTTLGWSSNSGRATKFVPTRDMTVIKIGFIVTGASGSNDSIDVGIFNAAGTRLINSGATAGLVNSTGIKKVTISSTALTAGTVYYVCACYGAVGSSAGNWAAWATSSNANEMYGQTVGTSESIGLAVATLPSTLTYAFQSNQTYAMAVLES